MTVTGQTLAENIAAWDPRSEHVSNDALALYAIGSQPSGKGVDEVKAMLAVRG